MPPTTAPKPTPAPKPKGTHAQRTGKSKAAAAYTPPGQLDAEITGKQTARREQGRKRVEERRRVEEPPASEDAESAENAASPAAGGRSLPSLPSLPSGGGGPVQTGSGIILGVVGYAILLNWIRGGPSQVKGWILAKLINKPYDARKAGSADEMKGGK
jgi:hypothetical protein